MNVRSFVAAFVLILPIAATAQNPNLVPNPGFEQNTGCPTLINEFYKCKNWYLPTPGTSDYFNRCQTTHPTYLDPGIPKNSFGYQDAAEGNAYAGLISYSGPMTGVYQNNYCEYIAISIPALTIDISYEVSMSISRADYTHAKSNIGVLFFDRAYIRNVPFELLNIPQVSYSHYGIITDAINWTRLSDTLVADSAYNHMIIGSFGGTVQPMDSGLYYCYYYIDSVVVRKINTIKCSVIDTLLCGGDSITVKYTAFPNWKSGNVFTVHLSDANGSFTNPISIGSVTSVTSGRISCKLPNNLPTGNNYRIRVISNTPKDTSDISLEKITIKPYPVNLIANSNTPICAGDTLKLFANSSTAGVSYSWTGPSFISYTKDTFITNIASGGNYIVKAQLNGCSATDTENVVLKPSPIKPTGGSNSPVCTGDTLKINGSSNTVGVSYNWSGPGFYADVKDTFVINPTNGSKYIFTTTRNGCRARDTVSVSVKPLPAKPVAASNAPICTGDTLKLQGSNSTNGVNYEWRGPGFNAQVKDTFVFNTISVATYILTTTLNGCHTSDTTTTIIKPLPAKPVAGSNSAVCKGDTLKLYSSSATIGVTYNWTGPGFNAHAKDTFIANINTSANYIIKALLNGCSNTDTETVSVKPLPALPVISGNNAICTGDTLKLYTNSSTPGVNYSWAGPGFNSNTQNINIIKAASSNAGTYTATVTLNGCATSNSITVTLKPSPPPINVSSNSPVCEGEKLSISTLPVIAGATYEWVINQGAGGKKTSNTGDTIIKHATLTDAAEYKISLKINDCISTNSIQVAVIPLPDASIGIVSDTVCKGQEINLENNSTNNPPTATYNWDLAAGIQTGSSGSIIKAKWPDPGLKKIILQIYNGKCVNADSVNIYIYPSKEPYFNTFAHTCIGDSITITPIQENATYRWKIDEIAMHDSVYNGPFNIVWHTTGEKNISLQFENIYGCTATYDTSIAVHPLPDSKIEPISTERICFGDNITINTKAENYYTYQWLPAYIFSNNNAPVVNAILDRPTAIFLNVTNQWGCHISDSVLLHAEDCCIINLPTAFTPNGDGNNDNFRIISAATILVENFIVKNRWGQTVYESKKQDAGWDGSFNNTVQDIGTYYYYLKYNCNGHIAEKIGDVTLIR